MTDPTLTVMVCGQRKPSDHECDSDGPEMCGGDGWSGPVTEENKKRATWGSVSCSKCGYIPALDEWNNWS